MGALTAFSVFYHLIIQHLLTIPENNLTCRTFQFEIAFKNILYKLGIIQQSSWFQVGFLN